MIHPIDRRGSRPTPDFRFIKEARGALTITNVMAEDNGKWTCEAENAHGYSENARPVKLVVLGECQRGRPSCQSTFKLETLWMGWAAQKRISYKLLFIRTCVTLIGFGEGVGVVMCPTCWNMNPGITHAEKC